MDLALHAWKAGLKTGAYYVRSKPPSKPQAYGVSHQSLMASASAQTSDASVSVTPAVCPCDV